MSAPLVGFCQCGCGQRTGPSTYYDPKTGLKPGEPLRFIHGHNGRRERKEFQPNTTKRCLCGCGRLTPLAKHSDSGVKRGAPRDYITGHNRRRADRTLPARLWERVEKTDGCWNWTGRAQHEFGYGILMGPGHRTVRVHRLSWELANGPIPNGLHVLHRCDNPRCVKPDHLFLGTQLDNQRDMVAKGRHRNGKTGPLNGGRS